MIKKQNSITLIGAGNVAFHLAKRLYEKNIKIQQVFSRKISKAKRLAKLVGAQAINDLSQLQEPATIYIIAVHDDAIQEVAQRMSQQIHQALVVHTSGAIASKVLKPYFKSYGCFYPLQTFSMEKQVDFETFPLCIYSPQKKNRQKLDQLARSICPNVYEVNDQQKSMLHVAAVFANNFSNHLFHLAEQISDEAGIDFDILKPLILETALKVQSHAPLDMQTGPAVRGDQETMLGHLKLLEGHPEWARLYRLLSAGIASDKT